MKWRRGREERNTRVHKKNEVQAAMDSLKKGKASDSNVIRAQDIKARDDEGDDETDLHLSAETRELHPNNMGKNSHKSDPQKGRCEEAGNHRPVCTVPTLYKLFSTLVCNRLYPRLDVVQPEDQGGIRRSYQTLDHLAAYRLTEQKFRRAGCQNVGRDGGFHVGI